MPGWEISNRRPVQTRKLSLQKLHLCNSTGAVFSRRCPVSKENKAQDAVAEAGKVVSKLCGASPTLHRCSAPTLRWHWRGFASAPPSPPVSLRTY